MSDEVIRRALEVAAERVEAMLKEAAADALRRNPPSAVREAVVDVLRVAAEEAAKIIRAAAIARASGGGA